MKTKTLILVLLISVNSVQSQKRQEGIFKDTIIYSFSFKKDFVLFDDSGKDNIYYRIEEVENKSLTNFFIIERMNKVKTNREIIVLKEFLKREENYTHNHFNYDYFINKFRNNVVIFIDSGCLRKKYYKVTPILIAK
jgi:cellulose synthase/poly-beta-1,6-N-acetylglucosamine synthase-like glycosyltransferase